MRNIKNRSERGFTLIELLVTVAILAILLMFAVPGFSGLKQAYQLRSSVNSVSSAIGWARSQAIRLQSPVVIIPNTSKGWSGGWKTCKDSNNKGTCDEELKASPALSDAISNSGSSVKVQINPSGIITTSASIGTFQVGDKKREIYIEMNRVKDRAPV